MPERELQWVVMDKIRQRMPGSEPKSGDRVHFVMVVPRDSKLNEDKTNKYLIVEDAEYARIHKLQLNLYRYLQDCQGPILGIFGFFESGDFDLPAVFARGLAELKRQRIGIKPIFATKKIDILGMGMNRKRKRKADNSDHVAKAKIVKTEKGSRQRTLFDCRGGRGGGGGGGGGKTAS